MLRLYRRVGSQKLHVLLGTGSSSARAATEELAWAATEDFAWAAVAKNVRVEIPKRGILSQCWVHAGSPR